VDLAVTPTAHFDDEVMVKGAKAVVGRARNAIVRADFAVASGWKKIGMMR